MEWRCIIIIIRRSVEMGGHGHEKRISSARNEMRVLMMGDAKFGRYQ